MFIISNFEEEDEGASKFPLKTWTARAAKVSGAHSWCALIDLDEEMDDIENLVGWTTN